MTKRRISATFILVSLFLAYFSARCPAQPLQWHQTYGPFGGNITAIAVNKNTQLAGLQDGGIYRSTNQGNFWARSDSGLPRWSITTIAINGTTVFAGPAANGVYRSKDAGQTWAQVNTALTHWNITALMFSGTTIFAGTSDSGIYRSTDAGDSWQQADSGLPTSAAEVYTFAIVGGTIFVGTNVYGVGGYGGGLWRSSNNGDTWSESDTGLVDRHNESVGIQALMFSRGIMFASLYGGGLFRSMDTGASWIRMDTALYLDEVENLATIGNNFFTNTEVSDSGFYYSSDSGTTWSLVVGFQNRKINIFALDGSTIFAGTDGNIFRSQDSGKTWLEADSGIVRSYIDAFAVEDDILYAGAYGGGVSKLSDTGNSWVRRNNGLPPFTIRALLSKDQRIYAGTEYFGLYRLDSGSTMWEATTIGSWNSVYALTHNNNELLAAMSIGIGRSIDGGKTWDIIDSTIGGFSILARGSRILVGSESSVFVSSDNGVSWSEKDFGGYDQTVYPQAYNSQYMFAVDGPLFRSNDSGDSWYPLRSNGLVGRIYALATDGPTIFAGTRDGVFFSTNNGDQWTQTNDGLNDTVVYALALRDSELFAGTKTGGVYRTNIAALKSSVHRSFGISPFLRVEAQPNPFSSTITFHVDLSSPQWVSIVIFDPLGREVWRSSRYLESGDQAITFDEHALPEGAYFYQVFTENTAMNGSIMIER
jgi:photosystem II stability/assembly factor-like uncharacterized protein